MTTSIVVGGTSGIGLATALRLAAAGDTVHVTGRDGGRLAAAREHGLREHRADGTSAVEMTAVFTAIGPIDRLVLSMSGGAGAGPLAQLDLPTVRGAFDAKFWGQFVSAQAALPHLADRASITFVTAGSARAAIPGTAGLAAVNGALEAMVRPLAVELAPVRVNAVSPGIVDTPWWDGMPADARAAYFAQAASVLPVRRVATADDIAEAVVLVATNPNITGTILETDGGARLVSLG